MIKTFNLRQIRNKFSYIPEVQLPLLGRGTSSAVFDNGNSVLKLTTDAPSYYLLRDYCAPQGPHFPTLIADHGMLNEDDDDEPYYLVEVEKLTKVPRSGGYQGVRRRLLDRIYNALVAAGIYKAGNMSRADHQRLCAVRALETVADEFYASMSLGEALEDLARFLLNYEAQLDLHSANIMLRGETLVFSDPVISPTTINSISGGFRL